MIGRVGGSIAIVAALMSGAIAQRDFRPHPPPEKFSTRPVQPPQGFGQPRQARFLSKPPVTGVILVEQAASKRKTLWMMFILPRDLRQSAGVSVIVDDDRALSGWLFQCIPDGCAWTFPVGAAFVARLRTAQTIRIEGTTGSGETASYQLPLVDFARAIEGLPTDPK